MENLSKRPFGPVRNADIRINALFTVLLCAMLFGSNYSMGQTTTTFKIKYDINLLDLPGGVAQLPGGDYVIGAINSSGIFLQGNLTRVDQSGNVVWCKTMTGTSLATIVNDVIIDNSGNIVVAGDNSPGAYVTKVDAAGNNIWATRISLPNGGGQTSSESATKIIQANDGDYVIAGNVSYFWDNVGSVRRDTTVMFVSKINSSTGAMVWSNVVYVPTANPDESWLNGVTEVSDGFVFAGDLTEGTGTLNSDGDYPSDAIIFKVSKSTGALVWTRKLGSAGQSEYFSDVTTTSGDKILACGGANGGAIMMRFDLSGNIEWSHRWTNGLTYEMTEVMETADGQYAAFGMNTVFAFPFPSFYGTIHKVTTAATPANTFGKRYTTPGALGSVSLIPEGIETADNGYLMSLMTFGLPDYSIYTVKTDPSGVIAPSGTCAETNFSPSRSNYTPTTSLITPTEYLNYATSGSVVITMANVTPVTTIDCRTVFCTAPPAPTVSTNPNPATVCAGQSVTLTASGGTNVTYDWYTSSSGGTAFASGASTSVSPSATTTYYVEAEDNTNPGCVSTRTAVTVTVNPLPNVVASPSPASVCSGNGPGISLSSNVAGTIGTTSFSWTVTQSGASGASAGSGTSINQTLTATGTSPGTVTYTVTPTSNGCNGNSATVTVTVNPIPTVSATPNPASICSGNAPNVALSSNVSGASFNWTVSQSAGISGASAASGNTIAQTLSNSGTTAGTATYTVTPSVGACNGTPLSVTVNVNPTPTASATPNPQSICSGQSSSVTLSSNVAATSYNWTVTQSGVTGASNGSGSSIAQTLNNAGTTSGSATYTVTPSAGGCNGAPVSVTVNVNPIPNAIASPNPETICSGEASSISLTSGVAGTTFNWTVTQSGVTGASNGSGSSIAQTLSTTGTSPGTATYTVTPSANTCNGTPVTVTVNVNVTPDLGTATAQNSTICEGQSTQINATGTGSTSFSVYDAPSGGTLLGATPFTVNPTATTTYYVEASNVNGCTDPSGRTAVTVTVIPTADPSWTSPGATCVPAGPINLNNLITGTTGGSWSGTGVSGNIFDPTGLAGQTVNITYTVGTAPCVQVLTQSISVEATITANWTNPGTVCESDGNINLNALITGTAGGTWSGTGVSGNSFNPAGLSGTVNITYTVGVAPCQDALTQAILINASPLDPVVTASNATICEGESTIISASGSGTGVTYNVYDANGNLLGTAPLTVNPANTSIYSVTAINSNGCVNLGGEQDITITVNSNPVANAGNDVTICPNTSATLTASGGTNYEWSTTETTASISVSPATTTTYTVEVSNAAGCTATASVNVIVYDAGSLSANNDSASVENTASVSVSTALNDVGNPGIITVIEDPDHGIYTVNGSTITYDPADGYEGMDTLVYVICDNFCSSFCDTAEVYIRITREILIDVPGGFSPNGDGINDNFVISGLEKYPENELYIYNRWGELVYQAKPYTNNWNGIANGNRTIYGEEVIDGTYFYILKLDETLEPLRGSLELRRK